MEELQCLAVWKEGSSRYLVGNVNHSHATSNEDRFRCFVYEKTSMTSETSDGVDYRVAQSGDATCNGLFSATEGSRTMTLTRGKLDILCGLYRHFHFLYHFNSLHKQQYSSTVFEQVSVSLVAGHVQPLAHSGLLRHLQFSSQKFHPKDNQLLGTRNENCLCTAQHPTAVFCEG